MLSWLNRRVPNGTHGGVRGRRSIGRLLLDCDFYVSMNQSSDIFHKNLTGIVGIVLLGRNIIMPRNVIVMLIMSRNVVAMFRNVQYDVLEIHDLGS